MAHEWMDRANCLGAHGDDFFPLGNGGPATEQVAYVRERFCDPCDVRAECLSFALGHGMNDGVWGGTTGGERELLKRRRYRARAKAEAAPPEPAPPAAPKQVARRVDATAARLLLADSGLTASQVAKRTGLDRDSLSKIRRGERAVILETTWLRIRDAVAEMSS